MRTGRPYARAVVRVGPLPSPAVAISEIGSLPLRCFAAGFDCAVRGNGRLEMSLQRFVQTLERAAEATSRLSDSDAHGYRRQWLVECHPILTYAFYPMMALFHLMTMSSFFKSGTSVPVSTMEGHAVTHLFQQACGLYEQVKNHRYLQRLGSVGCVAIAQQHILVELPGPRAQMGSVGPGGKRGGGYSSTRAPLMQEAALLAAFASGKSVVELELPVSPESPTASVSEAPITPESPTAECKASRSAHGGPSASAPPVISSVVDTAACSLPACGVQVLDREAAAEGIFRMHGADGLSCARAVLCDPMLYFPFNTCQWLAPEPKKIELAEKMENMRGPLVMPAHSLLQSWTVLRLTAILGELDRVLRFPGVAINTTHANLSSPDMVQLVQSTMLDVKRLLTVETLLSPVHAPHGQSSLITGQIPCKAPEPVVLRASIATYHNVGRTFSPLWLEIFVNSILHIVAMNELDQSSAVSYLPFSLYLLVETLNMICSSILSLIPSRAISSSVDENKAKDMLVTRLAAADASASTPSQETAPVSFADFFSQNSQSAVERRAHLIPRLRILKDLCDALSAVQSNIPSSRGTPFDTVLRPAAIKARRLVCKIQGLLSFSSTSILSKRDAGDNTNKDIWSASSDFLLRFFSSIDCSDNIPDSSPIDLSQLSMALIRATSILTV
jgi:hypothetical protein